ncbi:flagellar export chaperone FlgN [Kurthia senegalensis]|uniref:flagellar export chaperone FlgN n=1 Tax=Kurthia senegalensis TaxID=1033740 RepID=UPI00028A1AC1|nr:flagellar export chaperone FlgN [Kurthia senegalensis]
MSVQTIQSIMTKLTIMHQSLLKLETSKTALITDGNIDELNKVINDEQTHISAIAQLEEQRQKAVNVFFNAKQVTGVQPTMTELLARISNEADKQQLAKARDGLLTVVTQLKEKMI